MVATVWTLEPGEGALGFGARSGRTFLETFAARSPLKLLAPKNHGDFAWVFAAHYGGGMVNGDHVNLRVQVDAGAAALLGTQSATKVYRSPSGCRQTLSCRVEAGGRLVLIPDLVSAFEGARYEQRTDITLAADASLIQLEGFTSGRSARGERWAFSRYRSRTRIARAGRLVVIDATVLDPTDFDLVERMGRFNAFATLIVLGPRFRAVREHVIATTVPLGRRADVLVSTSVLDDQDGAIVRLAGVSVETLTSALRAALRHLPETLGDDPLGRKW